MTSWVNGGSSLLNGGDGNDKLIASHSPSAGSHGSPTLIGGAGTDHLFHFDEDDPGGQVTLDYNAVSDSPAGAGRDKINGFNGDFHQIDLTTIDANALVAGNQAFIFGGAFTAGHLRYVGGVLQGNTDNDSAAEFEILIKLNPSSLVFSDLIL
jgi:serralysin